MSGKTVPLFHRRYTLLLAVLIILATQILVAVSRSDEFSAQRLIGPDSYTRMLRVEKLVQSGAWYDRISDRTNAPYGETLHWGRPLDALLYGIAWVVTPVTDLRTAVFWAGMAIGPLIALLMIPAWSWGTRPFLGGGTFLMILILAALTPHLMSNLRMGRADHHGFLALLFIIQLAVAFRLANGAKGGGPAIIAGLAGGVMVWASVVGWIAQGMFACMLAYLYLVRKNRSTRDLLLYTAGLAALLTIALPLERPVAELFTVDFKRLSIVHWTLAVSAAATWGAIHRISRLQERVPGTLRAGILTLLLGGAVPVAVMGLFFPKFFLGPLVDLDPEIATAFLTSVAEFQSLLPAHPNDAGKFFVFLGPAFIATGFILYDVRRASEKLRLIYFCLLIGLAIYMPLALFIGRFALYAQTLALVPWAMATAKIMTWTRTVRIWRWRVPVRSLAVILTIVGPYLLLSIPGTRSSMSTPAVKSDEWVAMGNFLTAYAARNDVDRSDNPIIFTYLFKGPEIIWRTPYRVVGTPYDNTDAIGDTYRVFKAKTDNAAGQILERRGVSLILYCRDERENHLYQNGKFGSFLSRIENDAIPDWLQPIPLPEELAHRFKLFRVVREGRP